MREAWLEVEDLPFRLSVADVIRIAPLHFLHLRELQCAPPAKDAAVRRSWADFLDIPFGDQEGVRGLDVPRLERGALPRLVPPAALGERGQRQGEEGDGSTRSQGERLGNAGWVVAFLEGDLGRAP